MLNEAEIKKEIARLEYEESSYPNYAKLADLYIIRNQMQSGERRSVEPSVTMYSAAPAPAPDVVGRYGDSDFLRAVENAPPARAWAVMDELMDSLRVVNARVYDGVMRKLDAL